MQMARNSISAVDKDPSLLVRIISGDEKWYFFNTIRNPKEHQELGNKQPNLHFGVVDFNLQLKLKVHHRLNYRTWLKMDSGKVSMTFTSYGKSAVMLKGLISKEDLFQ